MQFLLKKKMLTFDLSYKALCGLHFSHSETLSAAWQSRGSSLPLGCCASSEHFLTPILLLALLSSHCFHREALPRTLFSFKSLTTLRSQSFFLYALKHKDISWCVCAEPPDLRPQKNKSVFSLHYAVTHSQQILTHGYPKK